MDRLHVLPEITQFGCKISFFLYHTQLRGCFCVCFSIFFCLIFLFVLTISENFIYLISEKCLYWNQNPFLQHYYIEQGNLQVSPVSPNPDWNYSDIQSCKSSNYHTLDLCIGVYQLQDFSVHSLQNTQINPFAHVCMCMYVCTYLHACMHM